MRETIDDEQKPAVALLQSIAHGGRVDAMLSLKRVDKAGDA